MHQHDFIERGTIVIYYDFPKFSSMSDKGNLRGLHFSIIFVETEECVFLWLPLFNLAWRTYQVYFPSMHMFM